GKKEQLRTQVSLSSQSQHLDGRQSKHSYQDDSYQGNHDSCQDDSCQADDSYQDDSYQDMASAISPASSRQPGFSRCYGLCGVKSHDFLTSSTFKPAGENSAICWPLLVLTSTLNTSAPIMPRTVPLSIARKCPRTQFHPL